MRRYSLLGIVCALASCAPPPPPPPPPTVVNISMTAAANSNAGVDGQGAPVTLRVYQLGSAAGFGNAEFFPLYNTDAATLGTDLIKRDDTILAPKQTVAKTLTLKDDVKSIGIFAGLRAFQTATWRASADIPPHQTTDLTITVDPTGVKMQAKTQPPPPKTGS